MLMARCPDFCTPGRWFLIAKPASIASVTSGLVRILGNFSRSAFCPTPSCPCKAATSSRTGHLLAIAATILISGLNYLGVRKAGNFQLVMTTLKVVMIGVIIVAGFSAATGSWGNFGTTFLGAKGGMAGFMAALVAALWAYDGWNDLNMVSGEIRNPERSIPLALIAGVAIVAVLYIGVNAAVQYVMPAIGCGGFTGARFGCNADCHWTVGRAASFGRHGALHVCHAQRHHHERRTHSLCRRPRWLFLQSTG